MTSTWPASPIVASGCVTDTLCHHESAIMKFPDVVELGFTNLRQARLRTTLTTLGVSIGVSAVVGMVSVGEGLQENLKTRLLKTGFFQTMMVFPRFENNNPASGGSQSPRILDDTAMIVIRQMPGVRRVEPDIRLFLRVEMGEKKTQAMAVAVPSAPGKRKLLPGIPFRKFLPPPRPAHVV